MTDRDLAIARAALEAAADALLLDADYRDQLLNIRALDPALIVAGVPEFSVAAGFRHVPEDVHKAIVQERDALRARVVQLDGALINVEKE